MARLPLLAAAALLLAAAAPAARGAFLNRPEQDCLNPMVGKVNQFNFFPDEYQSIIDRPQTASPRAQVGARERGSPRAFARGRVMPSRGLGGACPARPLWRGCAGGLG